MSPFDTLSDEEVQRINELQREVFDELYQLFEPPLPEGQQAIEHIATFMRSHVAR